MPTTTASALRASLVSTVAAISPTNAYKRGSLWRPVQSVSDVPGGAVRNFYLRIEPGTDFYDGVWGDSREKAAEMRIYTCYASLDETDLEGVIDEDSSNLFVAFDYRRDPQIAGFWDVRTVGWSFEDDTPGHVWGYHLFDIRYLVSHEV